MEYIVLLKIFLDNKRRLKSKERRVNTILNICLYSTFLNKNTFAFFIVVSRDVNRNHAVDVNVLTDGGVIVFSFDIVFFVDVVVYFFGFKSSLVFEFSADGEDFEFFSAFEFSADDEDFESFLAFEFLGVVEGFESFLVVHKDNYFF